MVCNKSNRLLKCGTGAGHRATWVIYFSKELDPAVSLSFPYPWGKTCTESMGVCLYKGQDLPFQMRPFCVLAGDGCLIVVEDATLAVSADLELYIHLKCNLSWKNQNQIWFGFVNLISGGGEKPKSHWRLWAKWSLLFSPYLSTSPQQNLPL